MAEYQNKSEALNSQGQTSTKARSRTKQGRTTRERRTDIHVTGRGVHKVVWSLWRQNVESDVNGQRKEEHRLINLLALRPIKRVPGPKIFIPWMAAWWLDMSATASDKRPTPGSNFKHIIKLLLHGDSWFDVSWYMIYHKQIERCVAPRPPERKQREESGSCIKDWASLRNIAEGFV